MAVLAEARGAAFGWSGAARLPGQLHDIGKGAVAFRRYVAGHGGARGPDHSAADAREAAGARSCATCRDVAPQLRRQPIPVATGG